MNLIVISYPQNIEGEHSILTQLFEHRLEFFHLRKPDASFEELKEYLDAIPNEFHSRVILHSHFELLDRYNLKGIHINSKNIEEAQNYEQKEMHRSISAHSFEEIINLKGQYDYAFLSPIFNSISKIGYESNFSTNDIRSFFKNNQLPTKVVALGGVDLENIDTVYQLGFEGAVFLGFIWEAPEKAVAQFNLLKEKCQKYVHTH